jgi:hypothetical protein
MTAVQVHARHLYMVAVVEMLTDLNQKNNVRGTVEVLKDRVGILVKFYNVLDFEIIVVTSVHV